MCCVEDCSQAERKKSEYLICLFLLRVWWRDSVVSLKAPEWWQLRAPQGCGWGQQMGKRCLHSRPATEVKIGRFLGRAGSRLCNKYSALWPVRKFALTKDFILLSWEQGWRGKIQVPCKEQQQGSLSYTFAFTQFFYSSMQQRWVPCPSELTQF